MALMPSAPSLPLPERMTPIACSSWSSASERKKVSMVLPCPLGLATRSVPRSIVRVPSGGMTCTRLGSAFIPSAGRGFSRRGTFRHGDLLPLLWSSIIGPFPPKMNLRARWVQIESLRCRLNYDIHRRHGITGRRRLRDTVTSRRWSRALAPEETGGAQELPERSPALANARRGAADNRRQLQDAGRARNLPASRRGLRAVG